jgi:hypothetical protein
VQLEFPTNGNTPDIIMASQGSNGTTQAAQSRQSTMTDVRRDPFTSSAAVVACMMCKVV